MNAPYCKKHDRPYEDTSLTKLLPFWECPECKAEEHEATARAMIAQRTTYQLVLDFEESERQQMTDELPTVRGWLMDELEKRNPVAFSCWLESNEASPRKFFVV